MPRKPPVDSARARFATSLAWHLDHGTRPSKAAGKPWTNAEFAAEVPTTRDARAGSRNDEPVRSPRSVANWRTGAALPEDIDLISRALFGPSGRHAEAREELWQAFLEARAEKLRRATPDPAGPRWVAPADEFVIDRAVAPSDEAAVAAPMQRQLQAAVARHAEALAGAAKRLSNSPTFGDMVVAASALRTLPACDPRELAARLGEAYALSLELGGFLEADASLRADPAANEPPLDPDIYRRLRTLVQTAAPWLRAFPSVAKSDDEAGKALVRPPLFAPARDFFRTARAQQAISAKDAAEMETLAKVADTSGYLRQKAGNRAIGGAKNLMLAAGALLAAYQAGADDAVLAKRATLVRSAAATLADSEAEVDALTLGLPIDVAQALRALVQEAPRIGVGHPPARPSKPKIPDDVENQVWAMILEKQAPPEAWRPFIRNLSFAHLGDLAPLAGLASLQQLELDGTKVSDLAPLAGLSALEHLDLDNTRVSDLAALAGLSALRELGLRGTKVSDLTPLAGLFALRELGLNGTKVSDLAPLADLSALRELGLRGTKVSDLVPLASLSALRELSLTGTKVSDLAPLAGLSKLQVLRLDGTKVSNLAPIAGCPSCGSSASTAQR
jgi:hypothetical protein